jgi:hypothetical protein
MSAIIEAMPISTPKIDNAVLRALLLRFLKAIISVSLNIFSSRLSLARRSGKNRAVLINSVCFYAVVAAMPRILLRRINGDSCGGFCSLPD